MKIFASIVTKFMQTTILYKSIDMSQLNSYVKSLLSPSRAGTFFAPFRSRSANPDGFDSKMKLWINAIEELLVHDKKLTVTLDYIHRSFIADNGIRPDKECIRLVMSEMKRRSRLVPMKTLKTSNIWSHPSQTSTSNFLDTIIDPNGWLGWGVRKLVVDPASWAISSIANSHDQTYSDLTDLSITDSMIFVSLNSLNQLSQRLYNELVRISKAEKQNCFEWQRLLDMIMPMSNTIIEAIDYKELLEMLDILIEYLAVNNYVALKLDEDIRLVKIANQDESRDTVVSINQKDVATARLTRAKEIITDNIDSYLKQAEAEREDAVHSFKREQVTKAKSHLRSYKRLNACVEQKNAQLKNIEELLANLDINDSNMMVLRAMESAVKVRPIATRSELDEFETMLNESQRLMQSNLDLSGIQIFEPQRLVQSNLDLSGIQFPECPNDELQTNCDLELLTENDGPSPSENQKVSNEHKKVDHSIDNSVKPSEPAKERKAAKTLALAV